MNFSSIYHRASDNYCYSINENEVIINIITGEEIDKVIIHIGDPFTFINLNNEQTWLCHSIEINKYVKLKLKKFWTVKFMPKYKRCRYFFEIISKNEEIFYLEDGFMNKEELDSCKETIEYFSFPWINTIDINKPPIWVNDTIWYEIFIDRFFYDISESINEKYNTWIGPNEPVTNEDAYGGNIKGIIKKLDYLKDLGISGIYLTPIHKSSSVHKYDVEDYYKIDDNFGDDEAVKKLVFEAHLRGIKVMLDGVFNHCSIKSDMWKDVMKNGKDSIYFEWFMINEWPLNNNKIDSISGKLYTYAFHDNMPKLNTSNQHVINYISNICSLWISKYNIDAIRIDAGDEISHECIKQIKKSISKIKKNFFLLGENWKDSICWLRGDEFDSVTNYPFQKSIIKFWINPLLNRDDFEISINRCYTMYMKQTNEVLFNILDSHDTARLITKIKSDDKFYQMMIVLFTMIGSVCIYYGTEVLLEGENDPDCRRCMPWNEISSKIYNYRIDIIKSIISLRNKYVLLRKGDYMFIKYTDNNRIIAYRRFMKEYNYEIEVILNCSDISIYIEDDLSLILISRLFKNKKLDRNGFLVRKIIK